MAVGVCGLRPVFRFARAQLLLELRRKCEVRLAAGLGEPLDVLRRLLHYRNRVLVLIAHLREVFAVVGLLPRQLGVDLWSLSAAGEAR